MLAAAATTWFILLINRWTGTQGYHYIPKRVRKRSISHLVGRLVNAGLLWIDRRAVRWRSKIKPRSNPRPSHRTHRRQRGGNSRRWTAHIHVQRLQRMARKQYPLPKASHQRKIASEPTQDRTIRVSHSEVACPSIAKGGATDRRFDTDSFLIAVDNCCSRCITNSMDDFVDEPVATNTVVKGIGGQVAVSLRGTVEWSFDDDDGIPHTQRISGVYYNADSPYRLYSPQHVAQQRNDNVPLPNGTWCATFADAVVLQWDQRQYTRTVPLDPQTNVALIRSSSGFTKFNAFCAEISADTDDPATAVVTDVEDNDDMEDEVSIEQAITGQGLLPRIHPDLPNEVFLPTDEQEPFVEDADSEVNMDNPTSQLLTWHYRLGHLSFARIKRMAARGDLPTTLLKAQLPTCAACLYGKATRRPWRGKTSLADQPTEPTFPGQVVAIDQMVSPTPGLIAQMKGFLTRHRYKVATVFVDTYSNFSYVYFQKTSSAEETLEAKAAFERVAASHGVRVRQYHADNGIFETDAFRKAVNQAGQKITFAAVNAHHQNGRAEKKIRDLQDAGRTMLIHAAHRWPSAITANLWPYAVRMACDVINAAPKSGDSVSPIEMFAQVTVAPKVKHWHTFGAPVYVLDSRLQTAGKKINKWVEKSRIGVYLGSSPRHSRRVALVLSLQTGHVSPQFHVAFDDLFTTVNPRAGNILPKSQWQQRTGFSGKHRSNATESKSGNPDAVSFSLPPMDQENNEVPTNERAEHTATEISEATDTASELETRTPATTPATPMQPSHETETTTSRSGRIRRPTARWSESLEQQRDGLVSLNVTWEVFHDGGYEIQDELQDPIAFAASNNPDVMYVDQALRQPDSDKFIEAMKEEVTAHTVNHHWKVIPRSLVPAGTKVLPAVWAMRRKRRIATGEAYKWKARLNLHGGKQELGVNYWETYAPVIAWDTIRLFLILTIINGWASRQIDFVLAYPQADIECPMYMDIPSHFEFQGSRRTHCLLLQKNLYGQKQAGRVWNQYLHDGLIARGFQQSKVDMCLYYRGNVALLIYTDDGIIIAPKTEDITPIIELLWSPVTKSGKVIHRAFNITDDGSLTDYLGVKVETLPNGAIKLSQPQLIQQVLDDLGFNERTVTKPTPAASTIRLHRDISGRPYSDEWHYRSIVGKLNFIEKSTRPDLSYAVHQCARFCSDPKESHATAVKRIGKYLAGTKDRGLILHPKQHSFDCWVDADFVGNWNRATAADDPSTAKSRTGFIITYAGCPVTWASKLQTEVALSSTEAEYNALSESLRHVRFMMQLTEEAKMVGWGAFDGHPTVHCKVFEDNSGALEMARLPKMRPRTKHLCVRLHHFREHVRNGKISIQHVSTTKQIADIATKPQPRDLFESQRESIMNWTSEDSIGNPVSLATIQLPACDVSRDEWREERAGSSRVHFEFGQLDVYPRDIEKPGQEVPMTGVASRAPRVRDHTIKASFSGNQSKQVRNGKTAHQQTMLSDMLSDRSEDRSSIYPRGMDKYEAAVQFLKDNEPPPLSVEQLENMITQLRTIQHELKTKSTRYLTTKKKSDRDKYPP